MFLFDMWCKICMAFGYSFGYGYYPFGYYKICMAFGCPFKILEK